MCSFRSRRSRSNASHLAPQIPIPHLAWIRVNTPANSRNVHSGALLDAHGSPRRYATAETPECVDYMPTLSLKHMYRRRLVRRSRQEPVFHSAREYTTITRRGIPL